MDIILKNLLGIECFVFIDDVIISSNSAQEHALRLEILPQRFDQANLQLHPGKWVFTQPQVNYLGFVLSENGIEASPDKRRTVKNYPLLKNVKDVRAFLRLSSFYRKLVDNFAVDEKPLSDLTKKDRTFV